MPAPGLSLRSQGKGRTLSSTGRGVACVRGFGAKRVFDFFDQIGWESAFFGVAVYVVRTFRFMDTV